MITPDVERVILCGLAALYKIKIGPLRPEIHLFSYLVGDYFLLKRKCLPLLACDRDVS